MDDKINVNKCIYNYTYVGTYIKCAICVRWCIIHDICQFIKKRLGLQDHAATSRNENFASGPENKVRMWYMTADNETCFIGYHTVLSIHSCGYRCMCRYVMCM